MEPTESGTVLYCYAGHSIFGKIDIAMLSDTYDVRVAHFDIELTFWKKIQIFIRYNLSVTRKIFGSKAVIINFGSWHTIWPVMMAKMLRKKSIILIGGFDAMSVPSLEYGVFYKKNILQRLLRMTYRATTWLCPVSDALVRSFNTYADPNHQGYKTGLLNFMPELASKIRVIPSKIDYEFWNFKPFTYRNDILALAYVYDPRTYILKGFDIIVACAQMMPEYKFTLAGFSPEMLERYQPSMPNNIKLHGLLTPEQVRTLYCHHKVYLLPSMTEGIGNTLLEAMLCGCTPIASDISIFRELTGDQGYILPYRDVDMLGDMIGHALTFTRNPDKVRQRVLDYFAGKDRKEMLINVIEGR